MRIYKKKDKIIAEIPFWSKRINPYMIDKNGEPMDVGKYPTLTGLIIHHEGYDEMGLAQTIDMDYKGKDDQVGDFVIKWFGEREEFLTICKKLKVGVVEMDFRKINENN